MCAIGEVIGWAGRTWSSKTVSGIEDPFLMQICCTIISPSFLAAGLFFILGAIINRLGPNYSSLRPKIMSITFISCDFIALVIQAIGGASASIDFQNGTGNPNKGANIMMGGIIFQIVVVTAYVITFLEFIIRFNKDKPARPLVVTELESSAASGPSMKGKIDTKMLQMICAAALATLFLYIRSIYRTIELANGWNGPVITNQTWFDFLDALQIIMALSVLNVFSPGRLLFGRNRESSLPPKSELTGDSTPMEK